MSKEKTERLSKILIENLEQNLKDKLVAQAYDGTALTGSHTGVQERINEDFPIQIQPLL